MSKNYKTYIVTYPYESERWQVELRARDYEEANARLKKIPFGRVEGEQLVRLHFSNIFLHLLWWRAK